MPGRVIEVRFVNPDQAVVSSNGQIDWSQTPYKAVRWHTDGIPAFEMFDVKPHG